MGLSIGGLSSAVKVGMGCSYAGGHLKLVCTAERKKNEDCNHMEERKCFHRGGNRDVKGNQRKQLACSTFAHEVTAHTQV